MTERQQAVYEALLQFQEQSGYAPTVRELADAVGRSPATVHAILNILKRDGWAEGAGRTLRAIPAELPLQPAS